MPKSGSVWQQAVAGAAALIVAVGIYQGVQNNSTPPAPPEMRGAIEAAVPENVPLSRHDFRLRWSGPENAIYDVRVTTSALEPIVTARGLETAELALSEEELRGIAGGESLLWRVEATLSSGESVVSETFVSVLE